MRTVIAVILLLLLFTLLARVVPPGWILPLYCLFTAAGMAFGWREWQRLNRRRQELRRRLAEQRPPRPFPVDEEG